MEEDIDYSDGSRISKRAIIKQHLIKAIDVAEERQKYELAHNPNNLKSLEVIRTFIQRKGRVCYGGTAMNAILPVEQQFYSPEIDLPDYDFFTPDPESDVREILSDLNAAGFHELHNKLGIHEGTMKIMVNFMPVADITYMKPDLYNTYHKRAIVKNGMHYTDPETLRMMMYLELSRPKGMVSRWEKVFERLQLINDNFPMQRFKGTPPTPISEELSSIIHDFIIENQRILCNAPTNLYARAIKGPTKFRIPAAAPIFLSPSLREDAAELKSRIGGSVHLYMAKGDVPERIEIRHKSVTVVTLIADTACHSYYQIPTTDGRIILIGSLEFLITLYLTFKIFLGKKLGCVRTLIDLSYKNYVANKSQFPPISTLCKGYQIGFASLLRKKVARIRNQSRRLRNKGSTKKNRLS